MSTEKQELVLFNRFLIALYEIKDLTLVYLDLTI